MAAHRRTALVLAAVLPALPLAAGCAAVDKALDCAQTAVVISESVDDLQRAVADAGQSPAAAEKALDKIDKNLQDLSDASTDSDIGKAVDDLNRGVRDVRGDLDAGRTPDLAPVSSAADKLTGVCSS